MDMQTVSPASAEYVEQTAQGSSDESVIVALVPAHNEAERIAQTVAAIRSIETVDRVIVVDDGSRDDTARIAEDAGAKVMRSMRNVGKGAALGAAAKWAEDADVVLLLDGDLGSSAAQATVLLEPVLAGQADMAIATFPPAGKAGFGLVKNLARKAIIRARSNAASDSSDFDGGFDPSAPLSGQRALTRACLDATLPFASGYGAEVALTIRALRAGFRLVEVPTTMSHAATGRDLSGFIHRGKQFIDVWWALVRMRFNN